MPNFLNCAILDESKTPLVIGMVFEDTLSIL